MEILKCDVCQSDIHDFKNDLFHTTAIINNEMNNHVHLCHKCFYTIYKHSEIKTINFEGDELCTEE